jgi:hypothetical protein
MKDLENIDEYCINKFKNENIDETYYKTYYNELVKKYCTKETKNILKAITHAKKFDLI